MQNNQQENNGKIVVILIYCLYATVMMTLGFGVVIGGMLAFIKKDQCTNDLYKTHFIYQLKILKWAISILILALIIVLIPLAILFHLDKGNIIDFLTLPAFIILFIPILIYAGMVIKGLYKITRNEGM